MRGLGRAVLALLLAGQASAAVVSAEAPLPLSYVANLTGPAPTLSAAAAFLSDGGAQSWLLKNRPGAYPALVARALRLNDWRQTLAAHDDPRLLREAVLARANDPIGASPAALLGLVDRDPALAAKRRLYEVAALEWGALSERLQGELAAQDHGEPEWRAMSLPARYDAARDALGALAAETITAAPGSAEYAAQYEDVLDHLSAVMTDVELREHKIELARAKAIAGALTRAEHASAEAGGVGAELLARARASGDIDEAEARVDAALAALGQAPAAAPAEPALNLTAGERIRLSEAMAVAFERELSGIPAGRDILAALGDGSASLSVGPAERGTMADYKPALAAIVVSERMLAAFAAGLGRSPRELLSDARLRDDAALFFAPYVVHEGEHHRQFAWARAQGLGLSVYSQQWELEAFAAQATFIRQKRAADPRLEALQERLRPVLPNLAEELDLPEEIDRDPAAHKLWLARAYRAVPTLSRAGAKVISAALSQADAQRGTLSAIERDLAAARRSFRGRERASEDPDVGALRRERDRLARLASDALEAVGKLMDRSRAEILRLDAARRRREVQKR